MLNIEEKKKCIPVIEFDNDGKFMYAIEYTIDGGKTRERIFVEDYQLTGNWEGFRCIMIGKASSYDENFD